MSGKEAFRFPIGIVGALEPLAPAKPAIICGSIAAIAELAGAVGYDSIELHLRNPAELDGQALLRAAKDRGLRYCALSTGLEYLSNGLSLISDDASVRRAAVQRLREHIDLAAVLGCLVVIGSMRANVPDPANRAPYDGYLTDALLNLAAYARTQGVGLVFESINRYINNTFNTVPETAAYLRALGQSNLRLHIDTHSMNVEDPDLPAAVRGAADVLGYVHFSDSNRRFPGGGNIDFKPILKALLDVGYTGDITCECVPWPDPEQCARLSYTYIRALETCLAVEAIRDY
jgi:sugar phosphate isomerase/epimerase